jgi:anti-sigma factor RsiW
MATCREIDALLTAYLDGEAPDGDRALIERHLSSCVPCRARRAAEERGRQVVRARASALVGSAPPGLETRCRAAAAAARRQPGLRRAALWLLPASMAAVLLLAVGGLAVFVSLASPRRALATQLALDHVKCFTLFGRDAGTAEPRLVESRLREQYGWRLTVPGSSAQEGLELLGARRCYTTDGQVAHILYRHQGQPLSLFLLPVAGGGSEVMTVVGHNAVIWSRGGRTFAVVARDTRPRLEQVAAYLRRALE